MFVVVPGGLDVHFTFKLGAQVQRLLCAMMMRQSFCRSVQGHRFCAHIKTVEGAQSKATHCRETFCPIPILSVLRCVQDHRRIVAFDEHARSSGTHCAATCQDEESTTIITQDCLLPGALLDVHNGRFMLLNIRELERTGWEPPASTGAQHTPFTKGDKHSLPSSMFSSGRLPNHCVCNVTSDQFL